MQVPLLSNARFVFAIYHTATTRLAQEKLKRWPPLFLVLYSVVCGVLKLLDFALQEGVRGTTGLALVLVLVSPIS